MTRRCWNCKHEKLCKYHNKAAELARSFVVNCKPLLLPNGKRREFEAYLVELIGLHCKSYEEANESD